MPNGFRGSAAESYLGAAGSALSAAATAHNQRPIPAQAGAQRPEMPSTPNAQAPHDVSSAHSGGNITGVGNSSNIVVGSAEYNNILSRIERIDDDMGRTLHQISVRIEEMCRGEFVMPQTVQRCNTLTSNLKNSLGEYRRLTEEPIMEIRRFSDRVLNIR